MHKKLELSHDQDTAVAFTIEVDFQADDTWAIYDTVSVPPGKTLEIVFPQGYSAHWVRLTANRNARATAIFYYS